MSRELDAAIAEALGTKFVVACRENGEELLGCHLYSTDGNAMLELDREMVRQGFIQRHIFMTNTNDYEVTYYGADKNALKVEEYYDEDRAFIGRTSTMPEAVALAAYKALTGKEWQE